MKEITVTFSVYGSFDINRLLTSIRAVHEQRNCQVQVIVSEQNSEPKLEHLANEFNFKHIFSKTQFYEGKPIYNPGAIRNKALTQVKTEFVYLNDADILFQNPDYLHILTTDYWTGQALIHPPLRRLEKQDVQKFMKLVTQIGVKEAILMLKHPNEYTANLSGNSTELKIVQHKNGRVYNTPIEIYHKYKTDQSLKGSEPTFWFDIIHVGSIFYKTETILGLGGYSTAYKTWGYEDTDLQWKLQETHGVFQLPRGARLEVLHLDHEKNYFSIKHNEENKEQFRKRQESGVSTAIAFDLKRMQLE